MINSQFIIFFSMTENKPSKSIPSRTDTLQRYHSITSPLVPLQTAKEQQSLKHELRHNASMRLDYIKNRNSKVYALEPHSLSELKASAVVYQIPEFSCPDVNFQVAEHIKKKVQEIKNQIITHLPDISRSSNYAPKKLQHQLNHRSAVRELEDWLKNKLQQPPASQEDTIQYKNMIMGVGIKELIRIIGKRCNEEGRIAEEIWEMTWGICREIILYLSKRAKRCEDLLEEELKFMRLSYQQQFERLQQENSQLKQKVETLGAENKELFEELSRLRKRKEAVEEENKHLSYDNFHIQEELKNILEENLAIYLQIGDKNKRGWIKKMYKSITQSSIEPNSQVATLYQAQIAGTVEQRNKLEQITEELTDILSKEEIHSIGQQVFQKSQYRKSLKEQKRASKLKAKSKARKRNFTELGKQSLDIKLTDSEFITEAKQIEQIAEGQQSEEEGNTVSGDTDQVQVEDSNESDSESQQSCQNLVNTMKHQFKPIDKDTQTEKLIMIHAFASTAQVQSAEVQASVWPQLLTDYEDVGVNTEDVKEDLKSTKKKGKENVKEQPRSRSKLYGGPVISKEKSKYKGSQKDKKSILDPVPQVNLEKTESKEEAKQALGVFEIKGLGTSVDSDLRKATTSSRIKNEEQRNSQIASVELKLSRQNDSKIGRFTEDPQRNKMISFFQGESLSQQPSPLENDSFTASPAKTNQIYQSHGQSDQKDPGLLKETKKEELADAPTISELVREQVIRNKPHESKEETKKIKKHISNSKPVVGNTPSEIGEKKINVIAPKAPRASHQSVTKQCTLYLCANCFKQINSDEPKFSRQQAYLKPPKRSSDKLINSESLNSLNKVSLVPLEEDDRDLDRGEFQGRRLKKIPTRRSSGYLHDIAFKKEIEGQSKSPHSKEEDQRIEPEEEKALLARVTPARWIASQFQTINREWIYSLPHSAGQGGQSLQQYLQIVKEVNTIPENRLTMTDKSAISTIEKNVFPILSQLLLTVRKAVKNNKISETMRAFTSLPSIVFNRISRKYGVKILALKHLKILLTAFKVASKFTDKYKTIELMMFTDCKSPQSEDLFIYLLLMGLFDPNFSNSKVLLPQQAQALRQICEEHLSQDRQVYTGECWEQRGEGGEVDLGETVRSVITNYRLLKISRIEELGFVFLMLKKDHWMEFRDFVTFLSVFKIDLEAKLRISKKLLQFCDIKSRDQKTGISENMFAKFLTACEELSLQLLTSDIALQVRQAFKNSRSLQQIVAQMFSPASLCKGYSKANTHDEELNAIELPVEAGTNSSPQIKLQENVRESLVEDYHLLYKKQKALYHWKNYSLLAYQMFGFLQNRQETKYLSEQQLTLIKEYLVLHILENEVDNAVGAVDCFSNGILGVMLTPHEQFVVPKQHD